MKNNPQKKILRQDGFPIGAEMAKKRYSSAGTTTPFLKQLILTILLFAILPVTALAAEEIKLFIGGQQITENGCYANQNGTWTKVDGTEPANGQFYYDAATFTLTLNKAEITNNQTVNVAEGYTYDGSVIAFSQTADVSLKIVVSQGTSTITGTGGIRVESTTGDVSLSIKGPGSLDVKPKGSNSGITLCSSKNTNLDIDGADVTASSPALYGVYLISSTDATSTSTITVNNGSLTTGGNGNVGIYYYWSGTSNAGTSSLTVSGNAVVDTRNSQIMAQNKETVVQVGAGSDGNGGIVFNGKNGTVYGDVTLQEDLEIGEGESLTIPEGTTLTIPQGMTLTNYGTLTSYGTVINQGTLDGNGTITCQHHSGGTATCTEKAKCSLCGAEYGELAPHTLTKTKAQAPTCTKPGNKEYWTCSVCNKLFRDEAGTQVITEGETVDPATDHDWKITYTWSEDNTTCTAKRVCKNDASHTATETATEISEQTKDPTCTEKGETTYTATFSVDWAEEQTTTEDIPANGHNYVNGTCTVCGADDPDYVEPEPEPEPEPTYYRVDLRPVEGATVILSADEVEEGGTLTFTIEIAEGYVADDLMVTVSQGIGKAVEVKPDEAGVYTVKEVDGLVTITVYGVTEEPATAIERVETLRIYAAEGILHVETPTRQRVTIVSMAGALIADGEQEGARIYRDLNAGVYIVRVGDYATKVRVE